jgi:hypothetical protein
MVACPRCQGPLERRERRGFAERFILKPLGIYPWYCYNCHNTYYRLARKDATSCSLFACTARSWMEFGAFGRHPASEKLWGLLWGPCMLYAGRPE